MHKEMYKKLYTLNKRAKRGEKLTTDEDDELRRLINEAYRDFDNIEDDYARYGLKERYIFAKTWREIADELGHFTDDSVRKCCDRAISRYIN